ncbi:hypothetical protein ASF48_16825 [Rathayibacter sp. Leaf299]|uniref:hypothetical protein n=1 Tax=Rathayibacter sp. Leaf299 TaxID=1736328 RepID=UPI0006F84BB2|nr:hypothetical protein [Rathayibacter sp. Leaf299]KQQ18998.1 hypothetical protein ASF48_16825 [Rathayibacter sp. Leaf299]
MPPRTRLQTTVDTACERGAMCVHDRAGHGLGALQLRLARATPQGRVDAIVASVDDEGWIELVLWDSGATERVWHHAATALAAGAPVSFHARYGVLTAGAQQISVARG